MNKPAPPISVINMYMAREDIHVRETKGRYAPKQIRRRALRPRALVYSALLIVLALV